MQKKTGEKYVISILIMTIVFYMLMQFASSIEVFAEESLHIGSSWNYTYVENDKNYNDQEFIAPVTGVYEIKAYGESKPTINLRVKDASNPDQLVTSRQIQGGNGGLTYGYLQLNEGEKIYVHIMKGNSAGQIEQTTTQLNNRELTFGKSCTVSKGGSYYDPDARITTIKDTVLKANAGKYYCTDYENGYSTPGDGRIYSEMCPDITYKGVTYTSKVEEGGSTEEAHCLITLKDVGGSYKTYIVKHWQQNTNGNASEHNPQNYTLKDTETFMDKDHDSVTPSTKIYDGFTAPQAQTVTLSSESTVEINYYYTRNKTQQEEPTKGESTKEEKTEETTTPEKETTKTEGIKASTEKTQITKKDDTQTPDTKLPQTGETSIVVIALVTLSVLSFILYVSYRKIKRII